jgi:hypothetical protein
MQDGVITCPAIRGIVHGGQLEHEDLKAAVKDLVRVFAGDDRLRRPNEPGSLANVAGFFAIFNHAVPQGGLLKQLFHPLLDAHDAAAVAAGKESQREFDLHLLGSRGDHPGTVNFLTIDGFQAAQFEEVMRGFSKDGKLTIDGIAGMIAKANGGEWDEKGGTADLAKSSGEWGLMVAALGPDVAVDDLRRLYSERDPAKLLEGTRRASAHDWLKATVRIAAAIAKRTGDSIALALHSQFGNINEKESDRLCPCKRCNREVWEAVG